MAVLPALRQAAQAVAAEPEQRAANPWYCLERIASNAVHDHVKAWRQWRDLAAEVWFHALFAGVPSSATESEAGASRSTCSNCSARHSATGANGCCQFAEHCAILNGTST